MIVNIFILTKGKVVKVFSSFRYFAMI